MNIYRRSGGTTPFILNICTRLRWVVNFAPRPLYPQGKTPVPIQWEVGRASEPVWTFRKRERSFVLTGTRSLGPLKFSSVVLRKYPVVYKPHADPVAWFCGRSLAAIVGSNPAGRINVCFECCVLSGRGLWVGLITRPEKSYRLWCVVFCDLETPWMGRPWSKGGCCTKNKQTPPPRYGVSFWTISRCS